MSVSAEQVGGEAMGRRVADPGQVLQLVAAELAVGADQAVGAGQTCVVGARVHDQQHHSGTGPRPTSSRQQRKLPAGDTRRRRNVIAPGD